MFRHDLNNDDIGITIVLCGVCILTSMWELQKKSATKQPPDLDEEFKNLTYKFSPDDDAFMKEIARTDE